MIDHRFAILGAVLSFAGSAAYALDTLRGRTQPNRISWALWALAPLIAFAAEISSHIGLSSLMTFAVGLGPLTVTIASFVNTRAFWRLTRGDIACGALSLAALAMWALTGRGGVAIAFSVLSDFLAGIPTLRKAFTHPESESTKAFIGGAIGAGVTLLALPGHEHTFDGLAFPIHIFVFDGTLTLFLLRPWARARRREHAVQTLG